MKLILLFILVEFYSENGKVTGKFKIPVSYSQTMFSSPHLFNIFPSKDATIILFDIGRNSTEVDETKSQTFYEQAKKCVEAIVMRKVNASYIFPHLEHIGMNEFLTFTDFHKTGG